jgi:alkylated DNA repair dioxygenase AlkB
MSFDLFSSPESLEKINMPGADVSYLPHVDFGLGDKELFERLRAETQWQERTVSLYGKTYMQPRLIAWYGDQGKNYSYSGTAFAPLPMTDILKRIKAKVEQLCGATFNSVLLNHYRDHNDSISFHSDNERELGVNPVIASVSFGEQRTFLFKPVDGGATIKVPLSSGSLLLMKGATQANWLHGINKETRPCGPRINLTFRAII